MRRKGLPRYSMLLERSGRMDAPADLRLVLCCSGEAAGRYFAKLAVDLVSSGKLEQDIPRFKFDLVRCDSQDEALARLKQYAAAPEPPAVILLSDALAESVRDISAVESWLPSSWAKEASDALGTHGVKIAIVDQPRRIIDIDRTITRAAKSAQLLETLRLAADKLAYMSRPARRGETPAVEVRLIRRQHELLDYFRLRHRIYKIMGYLRQEIESAPSGMEMDWCDSIALHCAAYQRLKGGREVLAGTARVVVASSAAPQKHADLLAMYKQWVANLAAGDPVLDLAVDQTLGLELPIFHSQNLGRVLKQAIDTGEVYGELSRVIVAEDFRGGGLSQKLVEFAMHEAARAGVTHLFLECLELHEELYRKFGFERIEGARASVIGVNKTMIAMQRRLDPPARSGDSSMAIPRAAIEAAKNS
jgi:GNAT superfamily N-acetyltransferase